MSTVIAPTAKVRVIPIARRTRMLKQNPTTGIYLLLHQLLTEGFLPFEVQLSSEDIMDWHAFGVQIKPTTSISQTTNSSGGLSRSPFKTHSWLFVSLRSHPVHVSRESPPESQLLNLRHKAWRAENFNNSIFLSYLGRPDTFSHLLPKVAELFLGYPTLFVTGGNPLDCMTRLSTSSTCLIFQRMPLALKPMPLPSRKSR